MGRRDATVTRTLMSAAIVAMLAHAAASTPQAQVWPDAPADIQAFVRNALAERIGAKNFPDLDLRFGRNRCISIRREMTNTRMMLTEQAVPTMEGFSFSLRTTADL